MAQIFDNADDEARFRRDVLATAVRTELAAAGLPVIPEDTPVGTAGAAVWVDVPEGRGVLVAWHPHAVLRDAGQDAWGDDPLGEGPEMAAFKRLTDTIGKAMHDALYAILIAAGFEVTADTHNDYAPHELLVTRCLAPSPWQARRDAQFERRRERMLAAWNKHHEG